MTTVATVALWFCIAIGLAGLLFAAVLAWAVVLDYVYKTGRHSEAFIAFLVERKRKRREEMRQK